MTKNKLACLKSGCALAAAVFLMAQGPAVNSPADMNQLNDPATQNSAQTAIGSPDVPTYTGSDISRVKKPVASDLTSGPASMDPDAKSITSGSASVSGKASTDASGLYPP